MDPAQLWEGGLGWTWCLGGVTVLSKHPFPFSLLAQEESKLAAVEKDKS